LLVLIYALQIILQYLYTKDRKAQSDTVKDAVPPTGPEARNVNPRNCTKRSKVKRII